MSTRKLVGGRISGPRWVRARLTQEERGPGASSLLAQAGPLLCEQPLWPAVLPPSTHLPLQPGLCLCGALLACAGGTACVAVGWPVTLAACTPARPHSPGHWCPPGQDRGLAEPIGTLWGAWLVGWALFSQQELGNLLEGEGRATDSHVSVPVIGRD